MKQCPNPNCILYTRLEELPDAYLKCPGCGGALVDASMPSDVLSSGHLTRPPAHAAPERDEYEDMFGQQPPATPAQQAARYEYDDEGEYGYADEDQYAVAPPDNRPSRVGKIAFLIGSVTLLFLCLAFTVVLGSRLFPRSQPATGPEATQTVFASLRPPVNTPIAILPTIPSSGFGSLSGTAGQNGNSAPPTVSNPQLPQLPSTASTAPPAQSQPSAGILDARMSVRFEGGQPVGSTNAYNPGDAFNLAVQATFGPGNVTSLLTRWYGPDGSQIYQVRKEYAQIGTYYVGFTLKKNVAWPSGDYRADIHTNDSPTPSYSVPFSVIP